VIDITESSKPRYEIAAYIALAVFIILLIITSSAVSYEGDTLWHIRAGEAMIKSGAVLKTDIFTWTAPGVKWTAHEWLYEVIIAAIYDRYGFTGLQIITIIFCLIYSMTILYLTREKPVYWLLFIILLEIIIKLEWCIRPHTAALTTFSLLMLALSENMLIAVDIKRLFIVLILFMIWANIHSSVTLGLIVLIVYVIYHKADKKYIIAALVGTTATPQMISIFKYSWEASSCLKITNSITEWLSPDFHETWNMIAIISALAVIILIKAEWQHIKIKNACLTIPPLGIVLVLIGITIYLKSVRHISILTMLMAAGIRVSETRAPVQIIREHKLDYKKIKLIIAVTMLITAIIFTIGSWSKINENMNIEQKLKNDPVDKAVEFLKATGRTENILNEYNIGDYLIWHGIKPFIDGRADMYVFNRPDIWDDYMDNIFLRSERPEEILKKYKIKHLIFRKDNKFAKYISKVPGIVKIYENESVAVFDYKPEQQAGKGARILQ
jgi:hypothetical protein